MAKKPKKEIPDLSGTIIRTAVQSAVSNATAALATEKTESPIDVAGNLLRGMAIDIGLLGNIYPGTAGFDDSISTAICDLCTRLRVIVSAGIAAKTKQ